MKKLIMALCLLTVALTGCKTDSEDDIRTASGKVVINEICGKQDPDDDWVEFYNPGSADADLGGAQIVKTDEEGATKVIFTFPAGQTIKPGEYLVVATLTGELQAGISNTKQVGIRLVASSGEIYDSFDRDADVGADATHAEGGSYARIPDGTGAWKVVAVATRGAANSDTAADDEPDTPDEPADEGALVINEICGKQDPDDDWIELYNGTSAAIDLAGAYIVKTDEDGLKETIFTFPAGSSISPDGYRVVATLTGELQAGISHKKEVGLTLVLADGTEADSFDRDADVGANVSHAEGGSYARMPNGTGGWKVVSAATRGSKNVEE